MKKLFLLLCSSIFFVSCTKDRSCEKCEVEVNVCDQPVIDRVDVSFEDTSSAFVAGSQIKVFLYGREQGSYNYDVTLNVVDPFTRAVNALQRIKTVSGNTCSFVWTVPWDLKERWCYFITLSRVEGTYTAYFPTRTFFVKRK